MRKSTLSKEILIPRNENCRRGGTCIRNFLIKLMDQSRPLDHISRNHRWEDLAMISSRMSEEIEIKLHSWRSKRLIVMNHSLTRRKSPSLPKRNQIHPNQSRNSKNKERMSLDSIKILWKIWKVQMAPWNHLKIIWGDREMRLLSEFYLLSNAPIARKKMIDSHLYTTSLLAKIFF